MCRCNQGGRRVDSFGIKMLNEARGKLMVARRQKQKAEMARDFAETGGPEKLLEDARLYETSAREERCQARNILWSLEIRYGKAYVRSLAWPLVSASQLNGGRFETWDAYRKIFGGGTLKNRDIWL